MPQKTYVSDQPRLEMSFTKPGKDRVVISFVNGSFSTADEEVQKHIEGCDRFGKSLRLAPSALEAARSKAVLLRKAANQAEAEAVAAESAVKALEPKPEPKPEA